MRHAYAEGEREPRFLALYALFENDVHPGVEARRLIEEAAATGVVRPLLYCVQAQARETETRARFAAPTDQFTPEEAETITRPLKMSRAQRPVLRETYQIMMEVGRNCSSAPSADTLAILREALDHFPLDAYLASNVALLHALGGDRDRAEMILVNSRRLAPPGSKAFERITSMLAALQMKQGPEVRAP